jgi:hypothetical protein
MGVANDSIHSMKIGTEVRAALFSDDRYGGGLVEYKTGNVNFDSGYISSMRVEPLRERDLNGNCRPALNEIALNSYYKPSNRALPIPGNWDCVTLPISLTSDVLRFTVIQGTEEMGLANDTINSIDARFIDSRCAIKIYQDYKFRGASKTLVGGHIYQAGTDWNFGITSLEATNALPNPMPSMACKLLTRSVWITF